MHIHLKKSRGKKSATTKSKQFVQHLDSKKSKSHRKYPNFILVDFHILDRVKHFLNLGIQAKQAAQSKLFSKITPKEQVVIIDSQTGAYITEKVESDSK